MLDPNPSSRIAMDRIVGSSWFRKGYNHQHDSSKPEDREPSGVDAERKQELTKPTNLNAFEIISLSPGFDLSPLFEENDQKREVRFTSKQAVKTLISKLEDVAKKLRLKVMKKDGGFLKMERMEEGRKGVLSVDVEIFEVTSTFHLIEVKKSDGDTIEYQKIMEKNIRPALKDIVWIWEGDHPDFQQQQDQPEAEPR